MESPALALHTHLHRRALLRGMSAGLGTLALNSLLEPRLFAIAAKRCGGLENIGQSGFKHAAKQQPTDVLLDVLAVALESKHERSRELIAYAAANEVAGRETDAAQTRRFAGLLLAWKSRSTLPVEIARACVLRLPIDEAAPFVGKWFEDGGQYFDLVALKQSGALR